MPRCSWPIMKQSEALFVDLCASICVVFMFRSCVFSSCRHDVQRIVTCGASLTPHSIGNHSTCGRPPCLPLLLPCRARDSRCHASLISGRLPCLPLFLPRQSDLRKAFVIDDVALFEFGFVAQTEAVSISQSLLSIMLVSM